MRRMILICGMLLSAGIAMLSFSALAGEDRTRDIRCDDGYHWDDKLKQCVRDKTK
ncbi:MAG: hypothetical protein ACLP1W_00365 [Rhodomicrobium sp.]